MSIIRDVFLLPQQTQDETSTNLSPSPQNIDVSIEKVYQKIYDKNETKENNSLIELDRIGSIQENIGEGHFVDFVELLIRFILIAVSRTYASGDAFFVLEDLYGGEGLCIRGNNGFDKKQNYSTCKKTKVKITLGYVLIQLYQSYNIYLADSIGSEESLIKPLITFETKVDTLITLTPNPQFISIQQPTPQQIREMFLLLSASPEKICHRLLTLQPMHEQNQNQNQNN